MGGRASCNEKGEMMLLEEREVGDFDGFGTVGADDGSLLCLHL